MNDRVDDAFLQRLSRLEGEVRQTAIESAAHIATCTQMGISAQEARARMEVSLNALIAKVDLLMGIQAEQRGAVKFGKIIYAVGGAIAASLTWLGFHTGR